MAEVIRMPRLSDTMEEGKVESWNKKVGDKIEYGDILAEIETDKAVQEFETDLDGTLLYIGVQEGDSAPVDSILAIIGEEGENIDDLISSEGGESKSEAKSEGDSLDDEVKKENNNNNNSDVSNEEEVEVSEADIPDDVTIINMPRLSDTMEEGKVESWNKKVGDKIEYGDILAEIETDKAVQEFETDVDGTLLYIGVQEGDSAPVDSILAIIGPEGTDVSAIIENGGKKKAPKVDANTIEEANKDGDKKKENNQQSNSDVSSSNNTDRIFISPLAKKLAEEKGYDISKIKGSGDQGRIVKKDIENYQPTEDKSTQAKESKPQQPAAAIYSPTGEDKVVEHSQMRKVIARRLAESKYTAPHYYLTVEIDMENVMQARKEVNNIPDVKVSFNDIVIKAVAMALRKHPQVNSTWKENEMILHGAINIGVAVAVPDGLVVPVVKNADQKPMSQISAEVKDYATRSRDKKIKADEMEGSTFTVSNLGAYGIESFTSIINQPNSCILSVGAIVEKPVVKNGAIEVGHRMKLTLACDHRTVDGATGSLFLQTLKQYLETPLAMFV